MWWFTEIVKRRVAVHHDVHAGQQPRHYQLHQCGDSISEEESDEAIRSALQDLPRDLYTTFERYLSATMYARSPDRTQLMSRILGSNESFTMFPVRCIQPREWKLAEELLRRRGVGKNLKIYVSWTPVLR